MDSSSWSQARPKCRCCCRRRGRQPRRTPRRRQPHLLPARPRAQRRRRRRDRRTRAARVFRLLPRRSPAPRRRRLAAGRRRGGAAGRGGRRLPRRRATGRGRRQRPRRPQRRAGDGQRHPARLRLPAPQSPHRPRLRALAADPRRRLGLGRANLEQEDPGAFNDNDLLLAHIVAGQLGSAIYRCQLVDELEGAFFTTLGVLADAVELQDAYTADHANEVADLAVAVGKRMGVGGRRARPRCATAPCCTTSARSASPASCCASPAR